MKPLVPRRHLVRVTVPFEKPFLEEVGPLDERHLEVQSRRGDGIADRVTELGDDRLLALAHRVSGAKHGDGDYNEYAGQ